MPDQAGREIPAFSEVVSVSWYEHDCEWLTKFCDEQHRHTALVPRDVLAQYASAPARETRP